MILDIALGVAGGLFIFAAAKGLVELPGQIAEKRRHERHHKEALEAAKAMAGDFIAHMEEQAAKKPTRRKPAAKKAVAKKPIAKKGVTNAKSKARR